MVSSYSTSEIVRSKDSHSVWIDDNVPRSACRVGSREVRGGSREVRGGSREMRGGSREVRGGVREGVLGVRTLFPFGGPQNFIEGENVARFSANTNAPRFST